MAISDPAHWKEYFKDRGDKYDKILEMIAELNIPTVAPVAHKTSHQDGGGDEINGNLDLGGLKLGSAPPSFVTDIDITMAATPTDQQLLTAKAISKAMRVDCIQFITNGSSAMSFISSDLYKGGGIYFPASSLGSRAGMSFMIPTWAVGTFTLHIIYSGEFSNTFNTSIYASSYAVSETPSSNNAFSATSNFVTAAVDTLYEKSVTLSNVSAGDKLWAVVEMDANEPYWLLLHTAWVTWTG